MGEGLARARGVMLRWVMATLLACVTAGPSAAGPTDLAICFEAKATLQEYTDAFAARGWRRVAETDPDHEQVMRPAAEIIGTLRTFPVAFTRPREVRDQVDRVLGMAREAAAASRSVLLARDGLSLFILLETHENDARLSCTLAARTLPDVIRRLPEPGRNPSGEPLAWNLASSGPLSTPHVFAEIIYVRLFFQPAQHLLAGGNGIVTHLTFRHAAKAT